jgi:hypothetical protein
MFNQCDGKQYNLLAMSLFLYPHLRSKANLLPQPMYFPPLNPRAYTISQTVTAAAIAALLISVPFQVFVGVTTAGAGMFVITALLSLLLIWPLLLNLRATPPATLDGSGITLTPRVGRPAFVAWEAVREVKPYPLLPPPETETLRRVMAGRKKYAAAEGLMLVSDALPWPYRAVGWFAGEGFRGAFAVTSRAHRDYPKLKAAIEHHMKAGQK